MAFVLPQFSSNGISCQYTTNYHSCVDLDFEGFQEYLGENIDILRIDVLEGPKIRVYASVRLDSNGSTQFDNLRLVILPRKSVVSEELRDFVLRLLDHAKYPSCLTHFIAEELKQWK